MFVITTMNKNNQFVLAEFRSKENVGYLAARLSDHFDDEEIHKFIYANIKDMVGHFALTMEKELMMSEPLVSTSIYDQVMCYDNQFLMDRIAYIRTYVLKEQEKPDLFVVRDGGPTSRYGERWHQRSADNILDMWKNNPTKGVMMREDSHADVNAEQNQYYNGGLKTGIAFCDQSELGTSRHVDAFFNQTMNLLNGPAPLHDGGFGRNSVAEDKRLMQRRVFRSNEAGVENGVPVYEQRLYRRNLERDVRESLPSYEKGCTVYKHDMTSLFKRIDEKNKYARRYDS